MCLSIILTSTLKNPVVKFYNCLLDDDDDNDDDGNNNNNKLQQLW